MTMVGYQYPMLIKLAFPPAAAVLMHIVRSVISRHSGMGMLLLVASIDTMAPLRAATVINISTTSLLVGCSWRSKAISSQS